VRGVFWLAWTGLFRTGVRFVTWVSIFSLVVILVLSLDTYGFLRGYWLVQKELLLEDPLSLCLWVGSPGLKDAEFTPERRQHLSELLSTRDYVAYWLLYEMELHIQRLDQPHYTVPILGRTRSKIDPLSHNLSQVGNTVGAGIYVSDRLPSQIGAKDIPSRVTVCGPTGVLSNVDVRGSITRQLPWNHNFVVDEEWYRQYLEDNSNQRSQFILSGPVPCEWPTNFQDLPDIVRSAFDTYSLLPLHVQERSDGKFWLLETSQENGYTRGQWSSFIKQLAQLMEHSGYKPASESMWQDLSDLTPKEFVMPEPNLALIQVRSVDQLREVKSLLENHGFNVRDTNETLSRMEHIYRSSVTAGVMLLAGWILTGIGFFLTLIGLHTLRVNSKLPQIGMLKAIGMSPTQLELLFLYESLIIVSCGTVIGVPTAYLVGSITGPWVVPGGNKYPTLAFYVPWQVTAGLICILVIFCVCINLIASRKAVRTSPIETFQVH
jgi:hypothetical protein